MYIDWQHMVMARIPFLLPVLSSLCPLNPLLLTWNPSFAWCCPVHPDLRSLVNWSPSPHPSSSHPTPNSHHPRSIVRPTKTTSRSRLYMVRNRPLASKGSQCAIPRQIKNPNMSSTDVGRQRVAASLSPALGQTSLRTCPSTVFDDDMSSIIPRYLSDLWVYSVHCTGSIWNRKGIYMNSIIFFIEEG